MISFDTNWGWTYCSGNDQIERLLICWPLDLCIFEHCSPHIQHIVFDDGVLTEGLFGYFQAIPQNPLINPRHISISFVIWLSRICFNFRFIIFKSIIIIFNDDVNLKSVHGSFFVVVFLNLPFGGVCRIYQNIIIVRRKIIGNAKYKKCVK